MQIQQWLQSIARVVNQIGGYFTFKIGDEEYVVMKKSDLGSSGFDGQLELEESEQSLRDDYIEPVESVDILESELDVPVEEVETEMSELQPHHIPLDHDAMQESEYGKTDAMEPETNVSEDNIEWPASDEMGDNKVKFEPLRGDLAPELQE